MAQAVNITSPVGRLVMGSLYKANTTDAEGKPLVVKNGPNAGQPRVDFFFALAIPKGAEAVNGPQGWAHTPWGQQIWQVGHSQLATAGQFPGFAWKIEDGDSTIQNKKGKRPCDNEGWPGHWILKFSGGYAPKVYRQDGAGYVQIMEVDAVKPGHYAEVAFSVAPNGSSSQPGVYLNHSMVCFRAYGAEINFGPDVNSAGFGASALPVGASAIPLPGAAPMPTATPMPGVPAIPPLPGVAAPAVPGFTPMPQAVAAGAPIASQAMPSPSSIPVVPMPGFVQMPPPPAAPAARQMLPAANGASYEQFVGQGWTDAQLVAHGFMAA